MTHSANYPVLLADRELGSGSAVDQALGVLEAELEKLGLNVIMARIAADVEFAIAANSGLGAALLEWTSSSGDELLVTIDRLHRINEAIPVMLLAERSEVEQIPLEVAERSKGFFWVTEDTQTFVAGRVERLVRGSVEGLMSPFFGALKRYVDDYNWSWSCPGHNGGMLYRKTPLGQAFFDFVGENFLRRDLCNASVELGSILQHEGSVLDAETRAAEVFGAERPYFVLNGTSTSSKMVTLGLLTPDDHDDDLHQARRGGQGRKEQGLHNVERHDAEATTSSSSGSGGLPGWAWGLIGAAVAAIVIWGIVAIRRRQKPSPASPTADAPSADCEPRQADGEPPGSDPGPSGPA